MSNEANSTAAIAHDLVTLCRQGRNDEVINKYYAPNIVSVESAGSPEMPAESNGIDAVRGKNRWWGDNNEVHAAEANGPFVSSDNQFAVEFMYETTFKPTGQRGTMREMALYTVENGKIVREQFFYNPNG